MSRCGTSTTPSGATPIATQPCSATCSRGGSTSRRASSRACSSRLRTGTRRSTGRLRPLPTSTASVWDTIAAEAAAESSLWDGALLPCEQRRQVPVFSELAEPCYALGIETIYEGYLLHYGSARLFEPRDGDTALLLG